MSQIDDGDLILDLTEDLEVRTDPREALYNDYQDGIRGARQTLQEILRLTEEGFIPSSATSWWPDFLRELTIQAREDSKRLTG
jgi:hypothetical protein